VPEIVFIELDPDLARTGPPRDTTPEYGRVPVSISALDYLPVRDV